MKKLIICLTALFTATSPTFSKDESKIKLHDFNEIRLFNGETIKVKEEVKLLEISNQRQNNIEYIELNDGSIIDSSDIGEILLSDRLDENQLRDLENGHLLLRNIGDGSGG